MSVNNSAIFVPCSSYQWYRQEGFAANVQQKGQSNLALIWGQLSAPQRSIGVGSERGHKKCGYAALLKQLWTWCQSQIDKSDTVSGTETDTCHYVNKRTHGRLPNKFITTCIIFIYLKKISKYPKKYFNSWRRQESTRKCCIVSPASMNVSD